MFKDINLLEDIQHPQTLAYLQQKNEEVRKWKENPLFKTLTKELTGLKAAYQPDYYLQLKEDYALMWHEGYLVKKYMDGRIEQIVTEQTLEENFGRQTTMIQSQAEFISLLADTTGNEQRDLCLFPSNDFTQKIWIDKHVKGYHWRGETEIFYIKTNEGGNRPSRLFRYHLPSGSKELVYEDLDERVWMSVGIAYRTIFLNRFHLGQKQTIHSFDLTSKVQTLLFEHKERFSGTFNGTHLFTQLQDTIYQGQNPIYTVAPYTALQAFEVKDNLLILLLKVRGIDQLSIFDIEQQCIIQTIQFDSKTVSIQLEESEHTKTCLFYLQNYHQPRTLFRLDLQTFDYQPFFQNEVVVEHPLKAAKYQTDMVYALSHDGKEIPISLFYNAETLEEKGNPVYIMGYGMYGVPVMYQLNLLKGTLSLSKKALLDRGVIWACIHTRGGGEYGHLWHEEGRQLNKKNTFKDFESGLEYLVKEKIADKNRIALYGGSAGGILMGYLLNNSNKIKVAILLMPFLDVLRAMMDASLIGTPHHYQELGNPSNDTVVYDYMKSYCPVENVQAKNYPNILITTSADDIRTQYWQSAKFSYKVEILRTNQDTELLLNTYMQNLGHFGIYGGDIGTERMALEYAFLLKHLEV